MLYNLRNSQFGKPTKMLVGTGDLKLCNLCKNISQNNKVLVIIFTYVNK